MAFIHEEPNGPIARLCGDKEDARAALNDAAQKGDLRATLVIIGEAMHDVLCQINVHLRNLS